MSEIIAEFIVESSILKQYVGTFTPLVDEAKIHVNDDGLLGRVVDPANIAMLNPVELDAAAFESYDAPGAATIGLSLTTLAERIDAANTGELIHLAVDMETRHLQIQYRNIEHHMGMIDPEAIRQEPDSTDPGCENTIVIEGRELAAAMDAVDMVSDHIELVADPDAKEVRFVGAGDIDDTTVTFGRDELLDADVTKASSSLFSIDYFEELVAPIPDDAAVELTFDEEFPLEWAWEASEGHQTTEAMLAPRIRSD
jgi:proliferating cell nuclear antigen